MLPDDSRWRDLFSGKNAAISIALSFGVVIHAVNILMATTILPSVVADIGGLNLYAWNTTLFVAASIIGSVLSARLLAVYGARIAYLISVVAFFAGSLACALAPRMEIMLLGRTIQGFGGGVMFALSYAMINLVYVPALWPRAMALISGMWGVATLVGPAVGGIFAQLNAWRFAFGVMLPLMAIYGLFLLTIMPKKQKDDGTRPRLPLIQLTLLTAAVLVVSAGSLSPDVFLNVGGVVVSLLLLIVLALIEQRSRIRLLPENTFRRGSHHAALYITISLLAIGMTCEVFVPYFLQRLHGQSPLASGYMSALMALGWTVSEIISAGWKGAKMRASILLGPVFVLAGLVLLALTLSVPSAGTWGIMSPILLGLSLVGFGIGFGWPHLLTRILQVAAPADKEIAAASITTVQLFATALGAALAGMIVNVNGFNDGTLTGVMSSAYWLMMLLAVAPLIAIFIARRCAAISYG
ncbi:MFS transporter [Morganella morganii]|uniref:MFS transporter n=1 Tax=Morganella morganii TaxID=582 RepID=UPI001163B7A9|nr:MFS transporter [Morganella morganii]QQO72711.1 MFS transporter [Morganella morganii]